MFNQRNSLRPGKFQARIDMIKVRVLEGWQEADSSKLSHTWSTSSVNQLLLGSHCQLMKTRTIENFLTSFWSEQPRLYSKNFSLLIFPGSKSWARNHLNIQSILNRVQHLLRATPLNRRWAERRKSQISTRGCKKWCNEGDASNRLILPINSLVSPALKVTNLIEPFWMTSPYLETSLPSFQTLVVIGSMSSKLLNSPAGTTKHAFCLIWERCLPSTALQTCLCWLYLKVCYRRSHKRQASLLPGLKGKGISISWCSRVICGQWKNINKLVYLWTLFLKDFSNLTDLQPDPLVPTFRSQFLFPVDGCSMSWWRYLIGFRVFYKKRIARG